LIAQKYSVIGVVLSSCEKPEVKIVSMRFSRLHMTYFNKLANDVKVFGQ